MDYLIMTLILLSLGLICVFAFSLWSLNRTSRKKNTRK
ncbi:hypothetical protein A3N67_06635 [Enterobacter hormaechei subsp. steigerwaltii]|nr:hypothetical protein A3N67_06635 [Enterobacter hormaechei subsp. steigerwaltii]